MAELAGLRDDIELPEMLSGSGVVREDVARNVLCAGIEAPRQVRVPHHHHPIHDDGWRRIRDIPDRVGDAIVRVEGVAQIRQQIDGSVLPEALERHGVAKTLQRPSRFGVQSV